VVTNFANREEAEALKREKAEDEARIRHEEQLKYQEELKRQSRDAQKLLAELQQQQIELNKKQQSLMYVILKPLVSHIVTLLSLLYAGKPKAHLVKLIKSELK